LSKNLLLLDGILCLHTLPRHGIVAIIVAEGALLWSLDRDGKSSSVES